MWSMFNGCMNGMFGGGGGGGGGRLIKPAWMEFLACSKRNVQRIAAIVIVVVVTSLSSIGLNSLVFFFLFCTLYWKFESNEEAKQIEMNSESISIRIDFMHWKCSYLYFFLLYFFLLHFHRFVESFYRLLLTKIFRNCLHWSRPNIVLTDSIDAFADLFSIVSKHLVLS